MRNPLLVLFVAIAIIGTGILVSAADPPSWAYPRVPPETRVDPDDGQSGARNGSGAALMQPVVAKLGEEDMLSISAYLTSLEP